MVDATIFQKPTPTLPKKQTSNYVDDYDEDLDDDFEEKKRLQFLKETKAVPTPMEAYALWVSIYEANGGSVRTSDADYNSKGYVFGNRNVHTSNGGKVDASSVIEYEDLGWDRWTPTQPAEQIPAGYGSLSMEIFLLPDVVEQNLYPATRDSRKGWEYGHTDVYILRRDDKDPSGIGLIAETNNDYVRSYKDVDSFRKGKSVSELMAALQKVSVSRNKLDA